MPAPTFDPGPCTGLSPFQRRQVVSVAALPEFAHFVLLDGPPEQTFSRVEPGPLNVLWFDKEQQLHLVRIGIQKVLRHIATTKD